jgi:hypothetical protein
MLARTDLKPDGFTAIDDIMERSLLAGVYR